MVIMATHRMPVPLKRPLLKLKNKLNQLNLIPLHNLIPQLLMSPRHLKKLATVGTIMKTAGRRHRTFVTMLSFVLIVLTNTEIHVSVSVNQLE